MVAIFGYGRSFFRVNIIERKCLFDVSTTLILVFFGKRN